jgi:hypothetical protein
MSEDKEVFLSKSSFSKMIEEYVVEKQSSYIDAALDLCDKMNIDHYDVHKYVNPVVKGKIEAEAMKLNLLPKTAELSFE